MKTTLLSFIWKYMRLQRWTFLIIMLLSLTWSLESTIWPYLLRKIIDTLIQLEDNRDLALAAIKYPFIAVVILLTFVEASFRVRGFIEAKAFPKLEADIRMAMFDHIQHHSPKYFNEHFAGSLANKISDMTSQVTTLIQDVQKFLNTISTCILTIIFFAFVSPLFAWILAGWMTLHLIICLFFMQRCSDYSNIHGEARSKLIGKIVDSLTNNFAVNLFFRFKFEKSRISVSQKVEQQKNTYAQRFVQIMFSILSTLFLIGAFSIIGSAILYWVKGAVTTGEIVQVINTTWNVIFILWFSSEVIPHFYQGVGIATQALTLMHDHQDITDNPHAKPLDVKKGEIIFDNVTFHYGKKKLFHNKSVHIHGGEKVGLVGFTGAGKSTFVNLILRFFPVEQGKILIDDQDISNITLESLREQVALIPQDPLLFHRTLEENIRYGKTDSTEEEIRRVAKLAHCDEFIRKTPDGYKSLVGERGTKLSGGEKQRIAIARAMLSQAPILILDEATSALDSVTERYIQDSLEKLMQNRTTVVIAHRLSTLAKLDRILVFDQGKIVEEGSHEQLLALGGHYAKMWNMQAGGFLPSTPK